MILPTVLTEDGSITCRDEESGELYHNRAGAYTEALQHYIQVCDLSSRAQRQGEIRVLDVCFGLGYNTFVFIDKLIEDIEKGNTAQSQMSCHIIGIDKDLQILNVVEEVLKDTRFEKMCFALNLNKQSIERFLNDWRAGTVSIFNFQSKTQLTIKVEIKIADVRKIVPELVGNNRFDYIFHDGFSPRSMPELWTVDLFAQYAKLLNDDGYIITYSSATAVRGAFKECGLALRKSAPLGRKSGGTIAFSPSIGEIVNGSSILHFDEDENKRLASRSAIPYRDANFKSTRAHIIEQRQLEISQSTLPNRSRP
jgi:tRNA U34 5-methylaminomethyl-2-thiouridine-forming methyltransferase MnmC